MTLRRREYLVEATWSLDTDVARLYKGSGIAAYLKDLASKNQKRMCAAAEKLYHMPKVLFKTDSSKLRSRDARKAHKVNPVSIRIGVFAGGSGYVPSQKRIDVSMNASAIAYMINHGCDPNYLKQGLGSSADKFWKEFSPESTKGTIYHELAHWVDDSLRNSYIAKRLKRVQELGSNEVMKQGEASVGHTPMEINAQIHAVKAVKKSVGARAFNKMSWKDLLTAKSSLGYNFQGFKNKADYDRVMHGFVKRLHRERLLTRKLRDVPTYSEMMALV